MKKIRIIKMREKPQFSIAEFERVFREIFTDAAQNPADEKLRAYKKWSEQKPESDEDKDTENEGV